MQIQLFPVALQMAGTVLAVMVPYLVPLLKMPNSDSLPMDMDLAKYSRRRGSQEQADKLTERQTDRFAK